MNCLAPQSAAPSDLASVRRRLAAEGAAAALDELQSYLRRNDLEAEQVDVAGQLLRRILRQHPDLEFPDLKVQRRRIRLAGQCTTSWLANAVTAVAWREGLLLETSEAEYDNVLQHLLSLDRVPPDHRPHLMCLVPWLRNVETASDLATVNDRVAADSQFWQAAWQHLAGTKLIQLGCDTMHVGPMGYHLSDVCGGRAIAERLNEFMRRELPVGAYFVDLPAVAAEMGRRNFYDPRRLTWTKQPFSESGCLLIAEHIVAAARALLVGPKKVLVLDLDNTLWGGIVGETGPHEIGLGETPEGEAYRQFQAHVKGLADRGVLLAVASKNNPADARGPFELNPGMVLRLEDLASFQAGWNPKADSLRLIAEQLNLGLDSFVFFDDNPAEREHIRQALPQVAVANVPTEPADYVRALESGLWFETVRITDEDRQRGNQYQAEPQRQLLRETCATLDDYLQSLEMLAEVRDIDDADLPRVVQLLGKTNQFNLTTRRHSTEDVRRLLAVPRSIGFTVRLADRFGDHGLIALVLAVSDVNDTTSLVVDSWLMSCRVIGRSVEQFVIDELIRRARQAGFQQLVGVYRPSNKNQLVADLYASLGFVAEDTAAQGTVAEDAVTEEPGSRWMLDLMEEISLPTSVRSAANAPPVG